ncbi:MAG: hypothetical protein ACFFBH_16080 [Promethearchaeota archaeon]
MEQLIVDKKRIKVSQNRFSEPELPKCDICRDKIKTKATFYDSGVNQGIICDSCYKKFPKDDIELMLNLFNAYGGYYGKFIKLKTSVCKKLKEFNEMSTKNCDLSGADQINLQLLHAALLFGFTPREFFQGILIYD